MYSFKTKIFASLRVTAFAICLVVGISACKNQGSTTVPRTVLSEYTVLADSLFTMFPGTLKLTSEHILLLTPFDTDGFLKIYDRHTGREIDWIGHKGKGPGEWLTPNISNVLDDSLAVYDVNLKQYVFVNSGNNYRDISNPQAVRKVNFEMDKINFIGKNSYINACWSESHPFEYISGEQVTPCGQYPFKEKFSNTFDRFQGIVLVHPQKKIMAYGTMDNPYLALYKIKNDRLDLVWENQFKDAHYTVVDQQLKWTDQQFNGVEDLAFTKDYIACLINELRRSERNGRGRDIEATAKTIYLFDYKGKLIHILELPVHTVRLTADIQSNILYTVGLEPDYCIVKYNLSDYDL